ncbi:hypothetical protein FRC96_10360 [Lujinxingia vulgaris]|uniref:Uncharacterized protein n=1 Tax=Lujinxingia vulgaris TaxID=2600176 RepID=A0A5C6XGE1_9DELT|nr:hypothetical protein [Lujinxingia vulgaris]TXD36246.1 hypothetical protein FRC96_10360 [Lujinxingia vulgaris]
MKTNTKRTKNTKKTIGALAAVAMVAACAPSMANAFDDVSASEVQDLRRQGSGTGTLSVQIHVEADSRRDNAADAEGFETDFEVKVFRSGQPVRDATVTVSAFEGPEWTLRHDDDGEYEREVRGYHRAYRVDVVAGDDKVEGVYLAGPAVHTFTAPTPGASVPGDQPVTVSWQAEGSADESWLEGEAFEKVRVDDTTTYTVRPEQLEREWDEVEENEFELTRINRMPINGAASGSEMIIRVKNEVEVRVEPSRS